MPPGTWFYRVTAADGAGNVSDLVRRRSQAVVAGDPVQVVLRSPRRRLGRLHAAQSRNYGNAWALTADNVPAQEAHLTFSLPAAPAGRTLTGAVLRVGTTTQTWAGSVDPATHPGVCRRRPGPSRR